MLQAINNSIKGWLGMVIVALISLPFMLWGIQSYFDDAGPRYAAQVNDMEISANEFERTVSMQRQSMLRQFGGKLPIDEVALRERTLTQLVNQRLLESVSFEKGYRISDAVLAVKIKQMFTIDGVFDRLRFEANANSLGMSVPMFEQALRNELRVQQMQSAIVNSAFVPEDKVLKLAALYEQTRDITVLTFNAEHFSTAERPTEEEIRQYYEANLYRFMTSEKIKIDYVEITSDALADNVEVDAEQIRMMYEQYVSTASAREARKARHILIKSTEDNNATALEKIESLKQQLEQGVDFAELAKKYSQDPGSAIEGGDLDWISFGDMVKPFEQVLFDLEKGEISGVVESQFGYHLIKLDDVRSEPVETFEVKRTGFEENLKADSIASLFYDLSERLATTAFENPDSLDVSAEELELTINSSELFSLFQGSGDIVEHQKVRDIAFSSLVLEQNNNSDIIEITPSHVVVLRLNEHVPASAIPLEQVSLKIENVLIVQKGHQQTKAAALEFKSKIESIIEAGGSIESLQSDGVLIETIAGLGREDNAKVTDPAILQSAFEISPNRNAALSTKGSADSGGDLPVSIIDLMSGDVALVVLNKVNIADNITQDKLDFVGLDFLRDKATRDFSSVLLAIKENADISINRRLIEK